MTTETELGLQPALTETKVVREGCMAKGTETVLFRPGARFTRLSEGMHGRS